jgi:hypothetical protein
MQLESMLHNSEMLHKPEIVDNILNVINGNQPDIRQKFLESQRAPTPAIEQSHPSPSDSLPRAAANPLSTPVRDYEPMPLDPNIYGSNDPAMVRDIRPWPSLSQQSYLDDSGYISASHRNVDATGESGSHSSVIEWNCENNSIMANSGDADFDDGYSCPT